MKDIIEDIVSDVYEGKYNNHFDLEQRFRSDLEKRLRNEPNRTQFLDSLKQALILESDNHKNECNEKDCKYSLNKNSSVKIINAVLNDMKDKEKDKQVITNIDNSINKNIVNSSNGVNINQSLNFEKEESWFKRNVHYIYYTGAIVVSVFSFFKWVLPYLTNH